MTENQTDVQRLMLEQGSPADDLRAFRRSLGHFATGVTVITAGHDGQRTGLTANSFTALSLTPPLIAWSVALKSQSLPIFLAARHFSVNVLSANQISIAATFAKSGGEKFAGVDWHEGVGGAAVLSGTTAVFECSLETHHEGGDHVLFIGRVERYTRYDRAPLLFYQGRYGLAAEHPDTNAASSQIESHNEIMPRLREALASMSDAFQETRDAEGVTINESRILWQLAQSSEPRIESIARSALLSVDVARDVISDLALRHLVRIDDQGAPRLTSVGKDRIMALRERARQLELRFLKSMSASDVSALNRLLKALSES